VQFDKLSAAIGVASALIGVSRSSEAERDNKKRALRPV
jgi:hypothetical protein